MAVFRQVHVSFWQDAKVVEEMTPEDKYFYLYLMTNPNTKQIGIYPITKKQMAFDMGYSIETINSLMDRFENHHKVIRYNKDTREIALINWGKYNFRRGGKPFEDCIRKELAEVKDKNLIKLVAEKIENKSILALFHAHLNDTPDDTSTNRGTTRGQEKEKEKEKEKRTTPKKRSGQSENLCSIDDVKAFVESQQASNALSGVPNKLLVKYIDCLRLTRSTTRISRNLVSKLWERWKKYSASVVIYAMWSHIEKHDDKREQYTLGIMRNTDEHEANRKLIWLKNKPQEQRMDIQMDIQEERILRNKWFHKGIYLETDQEREAYQAWIDSGAKESEIDRYIDWAKGGERPDVVTTA